MEYLPNVEYESPKNSAFSPENDPRKENIGI